MKEEISIVSYGLLWFYSFLYLIVTVGIFDAFIVGSGEISSTWRHCGLWFLGANGTGNFMIAYNRLTADGEGYCKQWITDLLCSLAIIISIYSDQLSREVWNWA